MQLSGFRLLGAVGFSFMISLTAACGGAAQEPKAPAVGSSAPEPPTSITPSDTAPPKTSAVSSKDDGSDIIPPFTAGGSKEAAKEATKEPSKKAAKPRKGASAKPKKKG
jgi:hypothetical protein